NYQEYERALAFFREAETRKAELSQDEVRSLYQGIAKAQAGMREASNNSSRSYARSGRRRPGAIAFAGPTQVPTAPAPGSGPAPAPPPRTPPPPPPPPPPRAPPPPPPRPPPPRAPRPAGRPPSLGPPRRPPPRPRPPPPKR